MNNAPIVVRILLALTVLALLVSAVQRPAASPEASAGTITKLYFSDPIENSIDFRTGRPGMVVQDGEVRNGGSHICMGYYPDSLTVSIQGGDTGAIVDLGTLEQAGALSSTQVLGNGGNTFVAIRAAMARTHAGLQETRHTAHAPAKSGHVYLARIVTEGKPDILVKLLVLEFRPNESVTFRWQRLED